MAAATRTIDVTVTTNVRRGASIEARAKLYDALLVTLKPHEINEIPDDVFNAMALKHEPMIVVSHQDCGDCCSSCTHLMKAMAASVRSQSPNSSTIAGP